MDARKCFTFSHVFARPRETLDDSHPLNLGGAPLIAHFAPTLKPGEGWCRLIPTSGVTSKPANESGLGLSCSPPPPPVEASLFSCANSVDRI